MSSSQKVVVTGGSGFIGMHLMQSLIDDDIEVINIDRKEPVLEQHRPYWKKVDLLDLPEVESTLLSFQPTIVVHLAARTDLDEGATLKEYDDNIGGVRNLLNVINATESVQRILVTSSMLVCRIGYEPSSDQDYAPSTVYGESKVQTEKITREVNPSCIWAIVRPATIWGPYHYGLKAGFFSVLDRGLYLHPGRQPTIKSYGYVSNSVYQLRKLMMADAEKIQGKIFYLTDKPMNLYDWTSELSEKLTHKPVRVVPRFIMTLAAIAGDIFVAMGVKNFPITTFRLKNMISENIVDSQSTFSVAGDPPISMSQGIDETVAWLNQEKKEKT